jgi:hypothetical protein
MQRYLVAVDHDGPQERLVAEIRALAAAGDAHFYLVVPSGVGDANLFTAIDDELERRRYDVLVIGTSPISEHEQARLVDRLVRLYGLPVICVSARVVRPAYAGRASEEPWTRSRWDVVD